MASISTLQDLFTSSGLNTGQWTQFTGGSATITYGARGGGWAGSAAQVNFPASTTSSTDGDLTSNVTYDLTGSRAMLNVLSVAGAAATSTDCQLTLRVGAGFTNALRWVYEGGTLFAQYFVAGVTNTPTSFAFNAVTHAWWQIRETGGTIFWETSNDGFTWVVRASVATPITITGLTVLIAGLCFGVDTNPTPFTFRYFNFPLTHSPYNHAQVSDGMSRSEVMN